MQIYPRLLKTKTMKKLLLIALLSSGAYSQTNFHFYYGFNESLGAELLIDGKYGLGFSGTTEKSKALGQFSTGSINDYDRKNFISTTTQKWFAFYTTVGALYLKDLQISVDVGGWTTSELNENIKPWIKKGYVAKDLTAGDGGRFLILEKY